MIPKGRVLALLTLVYVVLTITSSAQQEPRFDFYTRGPYREAVPRPQIVTRFDVGDFHTNYATMERVIERIAGAAPDRVRVFDIGETNEYRMMHLLAISAPENIQRLDQIKANIARLSDPRGLSPAEAQQLTASTPVIVWLNYTIHGNESASFEAMMQVVYQLAASDEQATQDVLKNTVALVNVCANPDGHERFVTWYNSVGVGNPEPSAAEHEEPWSIYGRNNHYRFNLNRDNIATSQVETRHMQRAYLEWNPQVFVDHHGQTSQFFFPPAGLPINPNLPPEMTARWLTAFGRANAAQFDARGWDFYVRDIFDLFYPGYWDSWPSLQGATGMTYETDGGGWKGLRWKRDDETIVTLRSAIAKHFIASLTTLETASRERAARLNDYYKFRQSAIEEGRSDKIKRFVILPGRDPGRAAELIENLLRAGIEVSVAQQSFRSQRAHDYSRADSPAGARDFPAGSYVVNLAQPQKRLAKALLEQNTEQDAAFQREQLARYARNQRRSRSAAREEYGFYDITSWSLPFAFGVETFWTEDAGAFAGESLRLTPRVVGTGDPSNSGRAAAIAAGIGGDALQMSAPALRGGVTAHASIAYIIPYDRNGAAALAYRLLRDDFKLAVTTRQLNAGGRDWPRGTIVVRVSRNPDALHERIASLARETGVEVLGVNSGFSEVGDTGIGSETVISLKRPRIIVVADEPVSQTSYGAMWWLFDRYGVDFTPMTVDAIKRARLDNYNVIIMPDGSAGRYFAALGKSGVDTLRGWVERGGTLVCVKGAAVFAALKDVNLTSARLVGSEDEETQKTEGTTPQQPTTTTPSTPAGESTSSTGAQTTAQPAQRTPQRTTQAGTGGAPAEPQVVREEANQTEKMDGAPPDLPPIASPSARPGRVPEAVPGAIMRATLDRTTPLTYGYDETTLPVLVDSAYFFRPSKEGTNALIFSGDENQPLRLAGFIWPDTERLLRGTSYVIEEPTGRGHVVLYAEDPNFRAIWRSTTRLFFNSFLFQPVF